MERVVFSTNGAQTKRYPHATNRKKKKKTNGLHQKLNFLHQRTSSRK